MNKQSYANKGFQFAIITIVSFLSFLTLQFLAANDHLSLNFYRYTSSFLMVLVLMASLIGFVFSMKGLKDPNSPKKLFGIIVNTILFVLFVVTVLSKVVGFGH